MDTKELKCEHNKELKCLHNIAIKNKSVGIDLDISYEFFYTTEPPSTNRSVGFETHENKNVKRMRMKIEKVANGYIFLPAKLHRFENRDNLMVFVFETFENLTKHFEKIVREIK